MEEKREYGAEAFLRSVKEARTEKRRCEFRLEELRSQCERMTAAYGPSAGGGAGGDSHGDALLIAAAEQSEILRRKVAAYISQIWAVEEFITELPDVRQRTILRLRYVDLLGWNAVREGLQEYGLYYEDRQMFRLHGAALAEARRRFPAYAARHLEIKPKEETAAL